MAKVGIGGVQEGGPVTGSAASTTAQPPSASSRRRRNRATAANTVASEQEPAQDRHGTNSTENLQLFVENKMAEMQQQTDTRLVAFSKAHAESVRDKL